MSSGKQINRKDRQGQHGLQGVMYSEGVMYEAVTPHSLRRVVLEDKGRRIATRSRHPHVLHVFSTDQILVQEYSRRTKTPQ